MKNPAVEKFCDHRFSARDIAEIKEVVDMCGGISRTELANTVCELFDLKRANGKLKTVECKQFLEYLDAKGTIALPGLRKGRPAGRQAPIKRTERAAPEEIITGSAADFFPLLIRKVNTKEERSLWYEYVDRYHYLGYRQPFGAQLRYFVESPNKGKILGCLQFSSPAWRMAARDSWIGWTDQQRKERLQRIINNSRFLIFPWVKVKNLASAVLSLALKVVPGDWEAAYARRPVLVETLVDRSRFTGTCYKAANWIYLGSTTGRGRMDRDHSRQGLAPKDVYVYPLTPRFREELYETGKGVSTD
jgi:hypothetical protein